jgi:hypothetical protein
MGRNGAEGEGGTAETVVRGESSVYPNQGQPCNFNRPKPIFDFLQFDAVFAMNVENDEYEITVIMGEYLISHDQMGVYAEAIQRISCREWIYKNSMQGAVNNLQSNQNAGE